MTVVVKGTHYGFSTDNNGQFHFEFPKREDITLVFSFVGMKPLELVYTNQEFLSVVLKEEVTQMDEVVVTGMFERQKEGYTGVCDGGER